MNKTKRKRARNKRKKTRQTRRTKFANIRRGVFVGLFVASILVNVMLFTNIPLSIYRTGAGDFNVDLMGLEIQEPYGDSSKSAVIFSDENGNPYIDEERTNWDFDSSVGTSDYYEYPVDLPVDARNKIGWVYGAPSKYWKLVGRDNYWYAPSGCSVDVDGKNSGIPDLTLSIDNMYPSDSNGIPDEDYGWETNYRTLIDKEGNTRTIELNTGFITLELGISIVPDYSLVATNNEIGVKQLVSEAVGDYFYVGRKDVFGAELVFNAVFRLEVSALDFGDLGTLNPDWINIGNGIMSVYKRGFGEISEIDSDDPYLIGTQDTTTWSPNPGSNDITKFQNQLCPMFDSKESAIDKDDPLFSEQNKIVDFKKNNPRVGYFSFGQSVELGLSYQKYWTGPAEIDTLRLQMIYYVQRITVQIYTSVCKPLVGVGYDPVTMLIDLPDEPPKERLWDRLVNWVAELLGVKRATAQLIVIVCIIIIIVIIALIVLAIFAPQVLAIVGKAMAGAFKRGAKRRAARK